LTISPLSWDTPKDISLLYALVKEQVGVCCYPEAISLCLRLLA
jgi:hypothetical protein